MSLLKNIKYSPVDYVEAAFLIQEVGEEMLGRLDLMTFKPQTIIDVGCGTGEMTRHLQARYPQAKIIALDLAEGMLLHAQQQMHNLANDKIIFTQADAEQLPLPDQSIDFIYANLILPWQADFTLLLREWQRVLRPEGLLMFTALGPDTLQEWRDFFSAELIPQRIDMHEFGDALLQLGFADPVLEVNHYMVTYKQPARLIHELCASGMLAEPPQTHGDLPAAVDGTWPVTYEIIYAHAWGKEKNAGYAADNDGIAKIPLAALRRK